MYDSPPVYSTAVSQLLSTLLDLLTIIMFKQSKRLTSVPSELLREPKHPRVENAIPNTTAPLEKVETAHVERVVSPNELLYTIVANLSPVVYQINYAYTGYAKAFNRVLETVPSHGVAISLAVNDITEVQEVARRYVRDLMRELVEQSFTKTFTPSLYEFAENKDRGTPFELRVEYDTVRAVQDGYIRSFKTIIVRVSWKSPIYHNLACHPLRHAVITVFDR